jgi:arabinofuranan 3-O-arabinosyltransferase
MTLRTTFAPTDPAPADPAPADPAPAVPGHGGDSGSPAGAGAGGDPTAVTGPGPPSLRWLLLIWLLALIVFAATDPGRMIFDTKLGVDIDAAGFYARLWPLWNPLEWFGTLQDQYIGYAIPMAPFFLAGQLLHLPIWIIERLWLSLLVAVGFWGMVRLATALRVGSGRSRLLAGLVFALWPTFTIVIGSTSAAVLPGVLAPWAVLPLISAARGRSPAVAAARSGIAVLLMGGVNAVSTLSALVLPALFILTSTRGRQRISLCLWWGAAVVAATAWWLIPLLLDARYSFNFLPYVEQAATTTRTMSAAAFLRGSGNWTAYFNLGTPWLSAGWAMVTSPVAILASATAAAAGLYGIARRDMPQRRWLCLTMGLVALVALAGYWGPLGGPLHSPVDRLLDGALAPFRNVYKLEPTVAAVLALGCAHAMARSRNRIITMASRSARVTAGAATAIAVAAVLAGLALPQLTGQILQPRAFTQVPRYWYQAAAYLAARSPNQSALVVPAAAHGTYLWGDPIDDPLEPLARSPWAERGLVPYGGAGSQILLTTAENAIESGQQVTGLPVFLQRAGIRFVVVRNDLDPSTLGYVPPQTVHASLLLSGFRRIASFGPLVTGTQTDPAAPAEVQAYLPSYPAVEVFEAAQAGQRPSGPAAALPVSQTVLVNGGPDSLLRLSAQGTRASQPAVIAGDALAGRPAQWAVTDGQRRADNAFGLTSSNLSFTYTPTEVNPVDDPLGAGGEPPRQILPVPARGHQTVAVLSGAAAVTASSDGSWLTQDPLADPVNAFDGNPATAWTEGSASTPVGQWIQITFDHPVNVPASIGIRLLSDGSGRSVANQLRVSTAAGQVTTTMLPQNATQPLGVAAGPTRWLRITIAGASGVIAGNPGAGIRDVLIPAIRVTRYLKPPQDAAGQQATSVVYSFDQQHQAGPGTAGQAAGPAARPPLARIFTTAGQQELTVSGIATVTPGAALTALLNRLAPAGKSTLRVSASSTWGSLPEFGPANLFSGNRKTPWIAAGPNPVIRLSWRSRRRITKMVIEPAFGFTAAPSTVEVTSPRGDRLAGIGFGGVVHLVPPLTTNRMDVSFPGPESINPAIPFGQPKSLLIGLSKLSIPALRRLRVTPLDPAARFDLACGQGPALTIDGQRYETAVSGTLGALTRLLSVQVRLCTPGGALSPAPGQHQLFAAGTGLFTLTDVSLRGTTGFASVTSAGSAGARPRTVRLLRWQPDSRKVSIGPGPASYLEVHENANFGWAASLNGRRLAPARLDGWQQAFVVPAGGGGTITLTFVPASLYHGGLAVSALAIIALLIVSALGAIRLIPAAARRHAGRLLRRTPGSTGALAGAGTAVGSLAGSRSTALAGPAVSSSLAGDSRSWLGLLALTSLIFVIGGPLAITVPFLAIVAIRWPRWPAAISAAAMLLAGIAAATAADPPAMGTGVFGPVGQSCALVAMAAALVPAMRMPGRQAAAAPPAQPRTERAQVTPGKAQGRLLPTPFGVADELSCYYDTRAEPNNVHVEVRTAGHVQEQALRQAVLAALAALPRTRARLAPGGRWRRRYAWEHPRQPDLDPVRRATWADERELAREREQFLAASPALETSPPLRILLAVGPDEDCVILQAHHAALDGISCLDLLRSVSRHYLGTPDGPAQPDPAPVRPANRVSGQASGGDLGLRRPGLVSRASLFPAPAARIAAQHAARAPGDSSAQDAAGPGRNSAGPWRNGAGPNLPGYGVEMLSCPDVPTAPWSGTGPRPTVNDLLITALIVAIGRWNVARLRSVDRIRITVPINARPPGRDAATGNLSRLSTVTAHLPETRAGLVDLMADVTTQTLRAKGHGGPQVNLPSRALAVAWCPAAVRRRLLRVALRLLGPRICDTSLLSNLGDVADPPRFGPAAPTSMWFSTSAHMPRGLSVGAITVGGRLHLCFRYRRALFDDEAAAHFAEAYATALADLTRPASKG